MGDLRRFIEAQAPLYERVVGELKCGRKQSHWMWFVFPQLKALGRSSMAQYYGVHDLVEAEAYAAHPVLGSRLLDCVRFVLEVPSKTAHEIFGSPDDLKFCSCLTLFEMVSSEGRFGEALERFYAGKRDEATCALLLGNPRAIS
jgi:uncharacterized protein (DUF1810 family)